LARRENARISGILSFRNAVRRDASGGLWDGTLGTPFRRDFGDALYIYSFEIMILCTLRQDVCCAVGRQETLVLVWLK